MRFFVEVGPSGNLTSFISDVLHDKTHVAFSANNKNRSGQFQLQQLLANLYVNGQTIDFDFLFANRDCELLDLEKPAPAAEVPAPYINNTLPYVRLEQEEIDTLASMLHRQTGAGNVQPSHAVQEIADEQPAYQVPPAQAYTGQDQIYAAAQDQAEDISNDWPFIQRLLEQDENRAVAEFDLDVSTQCFIQDHVLYSSELSELDPSLVALPVVPLTVSLEMLAEVAALLSTQPYLSALENVRAYNWIALDEGTKTVRLVADRVSSSESEERMHAAIYDGENILLEGDVLFTPGLPGSEALLPGLVTPTAPIWSDDSLYTTGMFHGPLYHSVRHLEAWDETGIDVQLGDTALAGFFDPYSQPNFFLNPVLMDAVGHLTAFWIAQQRGTDFSSFPSQIRRFELVNPEVEATAGYRMRGRMAFLDTEGQQGRFLEGNYDCLDTEGNAIFRIHGWRDRFFDVPHSFYQGRTHPRDNWYGEDWSSIYPDLPGDIVVWSVPPFPPGFLEDAGAVWKRLLVYTLLSREEREIWPTLPVNPRRRSEWLMGRIALKEAARYWVAQHYGVLLYPADIIIRTDDAGKPYVAADGLEALGEPPQISLSHASGYSVAVAGPAHISVGVDLETFGRIKLPDFINGAFTPMEKSHVESVPEEQREEVALRMWCAKEAAAKSLGMGLNGRPSMFEVRELSSDGMMAIVHSPDHLIPVSIQREGESIISLATIS